MIDGLVNMMQRKRTDTMPNYNPEDLRININRLDQDINRVQEAIDKLQQRNEQIRQSIAKNNEDIKIFNVEIGKLENQKLELHRLIAQIVKERSCRPSISTK